MSMPPTAVALERLLQRKQVLANALLNVEMFDRWGPKEGPEFERMMREGGEFRVEFERTVAALRELATRAQVEEPDTMKVWAEAHITLLTRFIEANPEESASTGRFVAKEEIAAWREVAAGSRPFVDENCYYIRIEPALHASIFGPL
jgi:hypothetical protein